jgi:hypothetical protein
MPPPAIESMTLRKLDADNSVVFSREVLFNDPDVAGTFEQFVGEQAAEGSWRVQQNPVPDTA